MGFEEVPQQPDLPALEEAVLERWRKRDVFARSLEQTADGPPFTFYDGPPTASGRPGVHHVEARVFKDLFPRHRTMKGFRVDRKAGWDCHGIPVEIAVEKELGFTAKRDIEAYGVAAFNARCREAVTRYVDDWERLTERIGYWVDLENPYWTMSPGYVESVWWSLKRLWDADLLYQGHRVVPYCPRCGTALSDHEVAQGYAQAVDPSAYVRFPVAEGPLAELGASLLVWTTTPWTLVSNSLAAVGRGIRYVLVRAAGDDYPLVLAAERVDAALGEGAETLREVAVEELVGLRYRGPYTVVDPPDQGPAWRTVVAADMVTTTEGSGIVHMAPAFGEDDMRVGRAAGVPVLNPVDLEGRFVDAVTPFAGQSVKAADPAILADLRERGLLVRHDDYTHTYPFCWRCRTPLLYYAKPSWYITTTKVADRLLAENATVDWRPPHIREGRYGNWLEHNVDWALSRERYWGTPLPLWRCGECDHVQAVGSLTELGELAGADLSALDPHRPFVDDVELPCSACDGTARRVPEVIDAWYDSGSMPFAQFGYPHAPGSVQAFEAASPADLIAEGIDQTRGWFYSLHALGVLLFDRNAYRRVLCLGHIVDETGRKMSKSVGNVLDPWSVIDVRGADALRWLLLTDGSPWVNRRVGDAPVAEVVRKFLLTIWNTSYFLLTYARLEGWEPATSSAPPVAQRPVMDRWVLAELADTVRAVDAALGDFDATGAGRRLTAFADDLSNWYVRRSRSRFYSSGDAAGTTAAFATLHECLVTLAALLAPFTPFLADELYERLVRDVDAGAPDSVHLLRYPDPDPTADDDELRAAMAVARRVVELGRRARSEAAIGVRRPLARAVVTLPPGDRSGWEQVRHVVAEELNVRQVDVAEQGAVAVTLRLKPRFRALGPDFGRRAPAVAAAITAADADAVVAALRRDGVAPLAVDGDEVALREAHVEVVEEPVTGWQVTGDGSTSVALDLAIDTELRLAGHARELVRVVNDLRKRLGLALSDRIVLTVDASGEVAAALDAHADAIAADVLAVELRRAAVPGGEAVDIGEAGRVVLDVEVVR